MIRTSSGLIHINQVSILVNLAISRRSIISLECTC